MPANDCAKRWEIARSDHAAPPHVRRQRFARTLGLALAAACGLASAGGAWAQQTVIIGGDAGSGTSGGVVTSPAVRSFSNTFSGAGSPAIGGNAGGVVINDSALDALGPGLPTSGVPMAAPRMPVEGSGMTAPTGSPALSRSTQGGTAAYRLPGTGELVVTRPATLLHPPMETPRSRLAVPRTQTTTMAKPAKPAATGSGGKLTSRLIAKPPKKRLPETAIAPAKPKAPAKTAAKTAILPAKPKVQAPAVAAVTPVQPKAPPKTVVKSPAKTATTAPAKANTQPPAAPDLTKEMLADSAAKTPATPKVAAPQVAAPKVEAPKVEAPKVEAPAAAKAAPSAPKEVQQAARTTGVTAAPPGGDLRLTFASGSAELSEAAKKQLLDLSKSLALNTSRRVQLLAYAADSGQGASPARRLSLSRALAVRAFLIDQGVRSTRMDVRALGSKAGDGPADRVDVAAQ